MSIGPENERDSGGAHVHSEFDGKAGEVVQARDISGGVHFYSARAVRRHRPHQLPADVRHFVHRTAELGRLDDVLGRGGPRHAALICAITGTAGAGKTSLAVHWAHRVQDEFPDGQLYVNLRGYDPGPPVSPEAALEHFLRTFGVDSGSTPSDLHARAALFRSLVADQKLLILLDNAMSPTQVRPLLPGTSSCLVVVTSRSRLAGLSVREGARSVPVAVFTQSEATTLLREVMSEHRAADEPADLGELAQLCAGLPLALRVAAERAVTRPWMRLADLIAELRDESTLWAALSTAEGDETDALHAVFAWSYRALTPEVARAFRLLGLHPGPEFGLAAAAALTGLDRGPVRVLLDALLAAHLLDQVGPERYQFHDLLRAYALDQARQHPDEQREATNRVLSWYLWTGDAARAVLAPAGHRMHIDLAPAADGTQPIEFAGYDEAVDWYDTERVNLMAAALTAARTGHDLIAWQVPAVLAGIYDNRDPAQTWLSTEQIGLQSARRLGDRYGEGVLLDRIGIKYRKQRQIETAVACFRDAAAAFRTIPDHFGAARTTHNLGLAHLAVHELTAAHRAFEESLTFAQVAGSPALTAFITINLGVVLYRLEDLRGAEETLDRAVMFFRDNGDETLEARTLVELCPVHIALGQLDKAGAAIRRALAVARAQRTLLLESHCLLELGRLQLAEEKPGQALETSQRAAALTRHHGNPVVEARAFDLTGIAYQRLGRFADAIGFHRQAARIHLDKNLSWDLAVSLDQLATVLQRTGSDIEARARREEARTLLLPFTDPAATRLLEQLGGPRDDRPQVD